MPPVLLFLVGGKTNAITARSLPLSQQAHTRVVADLLPTFIFLARTDPSLQSDDGVELLDSCSVAGGQHFPTIPVLVAQLRDMVLSEKPKTSLTDCIPYASEA